MLRRFHLAALTAAAVMFAASACAHATTIPFTTSVTGTYTAAAGDIQLVTTQGGTTASTDTLTGQIILVNNVVQTGSSFTFTDNETNGDVYVFNFTNAQVNGSNTGSDNGLGSLEQIQLTDSSPDSGGQLVLFLQLILTNNGDIIVCGTEQNPAYPCGNQSYSHIYSPNDAAYISAGTLDPAVTASTPEPGSLILLGSGLLGVAYKARRRFNV